MGDKQQRLEDAKNVPLVEGGNEKGDKNKQPETHKPPANPQEGKGKVSTKKLEANLKLDRGSGEDDFAYGDRLTKEVEALVVKENNSVYETGKRLLVIMKEALYQEDTFNSFLAGHRTANWGRSKCYEVVAQVEDFILGGFRKVPQSKLEKVGWRKVQEVRGSIKEGIMDLDEALSSAQTLSMTDLIKLKRDWAVAAARASGKNPTILRACQTCTSIRERDFSQPGNDERVYIATIRTSQEMTPDGKIDKYDVTSKPIRLAVAKITYCEKRGLILALGHKQSAADGIRTGETCTFYREAII